MGFSWLGASSFLLLIVVGIFLSVPRLIQRKQSSVQIVAERFAEDVCLDSHTGSAGEPLSHTSVQTAGRRPSATKAESASAATAATADSTGWVIHWGRVAIFGTAVLSVLGAVILFIWALLAPAGFLAPAVLTVISVAGFATLRALAIRDAKARGRQWRQNAQPEQVSDVVLHAPTPRVKASQDLEEPRATHRPVKHPSAAPVSYAVKSLRHARAHHDAPRDGLEGTAEEPLQNRRELEQPFENSIQQWEPTPLPEPVYRDIELKQPELPQELFETKFTLPALRESATDKNAHGQSSSAKHTQTIGAGPSLDEILNRRRRS